MKNREILSIVLILGIFAILLPFFLRQQLFWLHIFTLLFLNMIICACLRLMFLTALLNLSVMAFMGIGAYTSAAVSTKLGISFWITMPMAGVLCAFLSFLLGFPLLRLIGAYFFIGTVCIGVITRVFFGNFYVPFFGGIPGFTPVAKPNLSFLGIDIIFSSKISFYYLVLVITVITLLIMYGIEKSKYGQAWKAIGHADKLAESIGIDLFRYKLLVFAICSFFCGIAGAFYGTFMNILTPQDFEIERVFFIVMYCVVGGMLSFWGPILGVLIMGVIAEFLRTLGQLELIGYGIILILAVRFMPQGVIGYLNKLASFAIIKNK